MDSMLSRLLRAMCFAAAICLFRQYPPETIWQTIYMANMVIALAVVAFWPSTSS
jgi:hypothetical protein